MYAVASRTPLLIVTKRKLIPFAVCVLSVGITACMSLLFYGSVHVQMLVTSFVCAITINHVVTKITRRYREALREAHRTLETRVRERTHELEQANQALRDASATQAALQDELMVRDRMATAGMLAAGVSHEIRSPLSVIRIALDEVSDMLGDVRPEVTQLLGDLGDATDRITGILRDLSTIARPVEDPLAAVDLADVVQSASRLASYRLGGAKLERAPICVAPVVGNASRLVQLVLNLVVNAARASRKDATNTIRIAAEERDDAVVMTISDTGAGMSSETKARLFEPFFTTGCTSGGTGLGLTICRSIVEKVGGAIEIDSELGHGTTVRVILRRA